MNTAPSHRSAPGAGRIRQAGCRMTASGCTLVEAMIGLVITVLLLGQALPMLTDLIARQRLLTQAAELETDLVLARSLAMTSGHTVRFAAYRTDSGGNCYVIHTGPAGACTCDGDAQARCNAAGEALRTFAPSQRSGIQVSVPSRPLAFDAGLGTVTPTATLRLTDTAGRAIHQVINGLGRVRSCTPNPVWGGLHRC